MVVQAPQKGVVSDEGKKASSLRRKASPHRRKATPMAVRASPKGVDCDARSSNEDKMPTKDSGVLSGDGNKPAKKNAVLEERLSLLEKTLYQWQLEFHQKVLIEMLKAPMKATSLRKASCLQKIFMLVNHQMKAKRCLPKRTLLILKQ